MYSSNTFYFYTLEVRVSYSYIHCCIKKYDVSLDFKQLIIY